MTIHSSNRTFSCQTFTSMPEKDGKDYSDSAENQTMCMEWAMVISTKISVFLLVLLILTFVGTRRCRLTASTPPITSAL